MESYHNEMTGINGQYGQEVLLGHNLWPQGHVSILHVTAAALEEHNDPALQLEVHQLATTKATSPSNEGSEVGPSALPQNLLPLSD